MFSLRQNNTLYREYIGFHLRYTTLVACLWKHTPQMISVYTLATFSQWSEGHFGLPYNTNSLSHQWLNSEWEWVYRSQREGSCKETIQHGGAKNQFLKWPSWIWLHKQLGPHGLPTKKAQLHSITVNKHDYNTVQTKQKNKKNALVSCTKLFFFEN